MVSSLFDLVKCFRSVVRDVSFSVVLPFETLLSSKQWKLWNFISTECCPNTNNSPMFLMEFYTCLICSFIYQTLKHSSNLGLIKLAFPDMKKKRKKRRNGLTMKSLEVERRSKCCYKYYKYSRDAVELLHFRCHVPSTKANED